MWAFFVLVALVFTCVYPYFSWVNNPNENVRTYMTMAIVEEHTFRIDKLVERYGWVNDMASVPEPDGGRHLFSVKGPAVSYAGVPVYWLMTKLAPRFGFHVPTDDATTPTRQAWFQATTFVLRLFTIQLPCFLFLVWLERWLRETSPDPMLRLSAVAAAGLGTNYLAYSLMFASHAPFAIAAFASFAITTSERARHPLDPRMRRLSRAFLAGLFAGLATLLEYHAGLVSVCLGLYALVTFWRPTRYAMFALGASLSVAALFYFQWRCFKNPLTPGHKMSENPLYAHLLSQGYVGGIGKPDWDVFKNISFNLGYGFFGTSPFMWLGLLAIPYAIVVGFGTEREQKQRRVATIAWLLIMLVLWLTVSAAINWRGGWTIGPRYLGAAPPFFAYGALCGLEGIAGRSPKRRAFVRGLAGGAALASVLTIGVVGMHFNTIPEEIVRPLTQFTWPLVLAGFVPHHALELFGVTSPVVLVRRRGLRGGGGGNRGARAVEGEAGDLAAPGWSRAGRLRGGDGPRPERPVRDGDARRPQRAPPEIVRRRVAARRDATASRPCARTPSATATGDRAIGSASGGRSGSSGCVRKQRGTRGELPTRSATGSTICLDALASPPARPFSRELRWLTARRFGAKRTIAPASLETLSLPVSPGPRPPARPRLRAGRARASSSTDTTTASFRTCGSPRAGRTT